jgi:hypothetical protein
MSVKKVVADSAPSIIDVCINLLSDELDKRRESIPEKTRGEDLWMRSPSA